MSNAMRKLVLVLLMLTLMTACANGKKLSSEQLLESFKAEGISLVKASKQKNYFVLKGKKSVTYTLDNGEDVAVYLFRSEKKRKQGLKDFNRQKAKYDMQIPEIYEVGDALVFYWYKGETGSPTTYGDLIRKAVDRLERQLSETAQAGS